MILASLFVLAVTSPAGAPYPAPLQGGASGGSAPVLAEHDPIRLGDDAEHAWNRPFIAGATYDSRVADPESILGQPVGSRLASHAEVLAMLRAMAATSDRVTLQPYGRTYEGRELVTATITSPRNHARLDEIRAVARRMWDPRVAGEDLDAALEDQPGVAWMGYGIHGDETSATEAAVPVAYHLAACTDADVALLLDRVVIVMDPCLNPDGRERIRTLVKQSAGYRANLDDGSMQRGRWPGGRGNHYLFDMNRDWMMGEAPETRGRWARLLELPPQLFVDAHEMSGHDTFLFYPQAAPRNANLPVRLLHWQGRLADEAALVFDGFGWGYYTREWADALYPGYSDAWGSLTGAIGMLYEQGRTIGAPLRRKSGEVVAYRETVHGQVAASLANLASLAANRREILGDYVDHRRRATEGLLGQVPGSLAGEGTGAVSASTSAFVVRPTSDVERDARFVRTMLGQGIDISTADVAFELANAVDLLGDPVTDVAAPAGSWIVPMAQPQGALVRAYLDLDPELDAEFLREERESIERGRGSKIYDVTAWNLARQLGLDGYWTERPTVPTSPAQAVRAAAGPVGDIRAAYAWVADGSDGRSLRFAARAMELGGQVHVADRPFEARVRDAEGKAVTRSFARGSFLMRRHENPDDVDRVVDLAARVSRAVVFAVASGRGPGDGPDLGGGHFQLLERPRVALLSNAPVDRADFGHVWRYLDEELALPVTLFDVQADGALDLDQYNVLVAPPGAGSILRERAPALATWVRAGGTLVAIGSSAFALADEEVELSSNRLRRDVLEQLETYAWATARQRAALNVEIDLAALYGSAGTTAPGDGDAAPEAPLPNADAAEEVARKDAAEGGAASAEAATLDAWRRSFAPAGVILRGELDAESWLTGGLERPELPVLFAGSRVLLSTERAAVRLAAEDRVRLGGLLWPEARTRIADSCWATVERLGRGQVVSFAASPVDRGSWRGTQRMFGNAVVLGPGMTD